MSTPTPQSLADAMTARVESRPNGRLRSMSTTGPPPPFAEPLDQDAFRVPIDNIEPDPDQPRKTFEKAELDHLAASIRENGLVQPIIVYRPGDRTKFRIIAGERRYRAASLAGLPTIPCMEMPSDFDPAMVDQIQLVENIQRADLRPLEAAEAIDAYIDRHRLSQREAARRLGKPASFVSELLAIRRIPAAIRGRDGVGNLSKQTLVEIGRAPRDQQARLMDEALAGSSLDEIRAGRANRESNPRIVHFKERFPLSRHPPFEIRWRRHPEEVTDDELLWALEEVVGQIVARHEQRRSNLG